LRLATHKGCDFCHPPPSLVVVDEAAGLDCSPDWVSGGFLDGDGRERRSGLTSADAA